MTVSGVQGAGAQGLPSSDAPPPRVVIYGSSTPAGHGASRPDRRFSSLLSQYLGWQEINSGLGGSRLSREGEGTGNVPPSALSRFDQHVAAHRPDRVVVMYGANDMHNSVPLAVFNRDRDILFDRLADTVGADNVAIVTPQPVQRESSRRPEYDAALRQGAAAHGFTFIHAGDAFLRTQIEEYSYDPWHLNDLGHAALASALAARFTDAGWAPPAPIATGGNAVRGQVAPLPAGEMLIDQTAPLTGGELRHLEARWSKGGTAVVGVVRPNAANGYDIVYRSAPLAVSQGTMTIDVPRWRVLPGDRLAVWTNGAALAGAAADAGQGGTLAVSASAANPLHDVAAGQGRTVNQVMAIRAVERPTAPSARPVPPDMGDRLRQAAIGTIGNVTGWLQQSARFVRSLLP